MKICGIIAEYNPFHQGHIYQLQSIQNQFDAIVVILSAYYSQRGLPSLLKPNDKANFALTYGANLVCQLPAHFTCQSAEYFAKYAIESLSYLGIDALCFGSECHSLTQLEEWNDLIQSKKVKPNLSLHQTLPERIQANDLLALHYLQECKKMGFKPFRLLGIQTLNPLLPFVMHFSMESENNLMLISIKSKIGKITILTYKPSYF